MADDIKSCVQGESYRLRSGAAQPICASNEYDTQNCICNEDQSGPTMKFIKQSFGVEKRVIKNYRATAQLAESNDMIGLNPQGTMESASYQATQYVTKEGEIIFTGQEQMLPEYTTEDQMPGVSDFIF